VIVPLVLSLSLTAPPKDRWWGADKLKHFFVAAFTQTVSYSALQAAKVRHGPALAGASAITAVVSVAKEVHDRRTTGLFSVRDLVWDAAGAGAATILVSKSVRASDPKTADRVTPLLSGAVHRSILGATVLPVRAPAR
jgi:uncharacterized protein YfiM (DUF2279 family)